LSLDVSETNKILDEITNIIGFPIGEQVPASNQLLEMAKEIVTNEIQLEELAQQMPFVKAMVEILKEITINDLNIYVLAPKSFLEVKIKIPGIKEVAERIL